MENWFLNYCKMPVDKWNLQIDSLPVNVQIDAGRFRQLSINDLLSLSHKNKSIQISEDNGIKPLIIRYRTALHLCTFKTPTF